MVAYLADTGLDSSSVRISGVATVEATGQGCNGTNKFALAIDISGDFDAYL